MKVLLSIKPEFAEKIFDGTKKFEFRRTLFKNPDIKKIVVYASSPVQKVIGEFEIDEIIKSEDLNELWNRTREYSGISKEYFFKYFNEKQKGNAIAIKSTKRYKKPRCIRKEYRKSPPQSFVYI